MRNTPAKTTKNFVFKAPAKKVATRTRRRVNREGQRWTENRVGMTLRLPLDLEMDIRQVALKKGDLSRIVLFALKRVKPNEVTIVTTRKANIGFGRPMLLHVGSQARQRLKDWAENEEGSVNQVVVSLLKKFFAVLKKNPALRRELDRELLERFDPVEI